MPVLSVYHKSKRANLRRALAAVVLGLSLGGCTSLPVNPNFSTIIWRDAAEYYVEGSLTRGFASRPKVAYIQGEGNTPDNGSFQTKGTGAGISPQGIYTPSGLLPVDQNGRFSFKVTSSQRFVLVRIFAWDDLNNNNVRDLNEQIASEYNLKKEDQRGWSYNAPEWNQFNFIFNR